MNSRDLFLGAIAAATAGCLAAVLWPRENLRTGARALPVAALAASREEVPGPRIEPVASREVVSAALAPLSGSAPTLAELECAAELALAEERSNAERIEALRALWEAGSPRAAELFATAIETLPDASQPESMSVPRFALAYLLRDAADHRSARQALERIAWGPSMDASSELRSIAALALAAIADEAEAWRILSRARSGDARFLENTAAALARNARAGSAAEAAGALVAPRQEPAEVAE